MVDSGNASYIQIIKCSSFLKHFLCGLKFCIVKHGFINNDYLIMNSEHLLIIFLKEPIPGKVKTRLAKTVGTDEAVLIYQTLTTALINQLKWIKNCHYRFCFAPIDAEEAIMHWILPDLEHRVNLENKTITPKQEGLPSIDFLPQSEGDLGDRLKQAFAQGFAEGYRSISAIGTDCPFISARWIETALLAGKNSDLTIGPTEDGGYYFINLKTPNFEVFNDINWSSETTYSDTIQKAEEHNLTIHNLPKLNDIDHESDWVEALESPLGGKLKKIYKQKNKNNHL